MNISTNALMLIICYFRFRMSNFMISNIVTKKLSIKCQPKSLIRPNFVLPVGQVVDLFVSSLELVLQVDQLPEVVRVDVLDAAGPDLDLGDRDQDLIPDDLNLGRVLLGGTLKIVQRLLTTAFLHEKRSKTFNYCLYKFI